MRGFLRKPDTELYSCLYCGISFEEGLVYKDGETLLAAEKAASRHVDAAHGGPFEALMARGADAAGLPPVQARVLELLYLGAGDAEIARELGGKAASTVRNHRFALRRREAEARVFLALMGLLGKRGKGAGSFVEYPEATIKDERAVTGSEEAEAMLSRYAERTADGRLSRFKAWPKKQKEKLVLLKAASGLFEEGRRYKETEVNAILGPVWPDYVTIRRYLIEYGFIERKPDCSEYWKA